MFRDGRSEKFEAESVDIRDDFLVLSKQDGEKKSFAGLLAKDMVRSVLPASTGKVKGVKKDVVARKKEKRERKSKSGKE